MMLSNDDDALKNTTEPRTKLDKYFPLKTFYTNVGVKREADESSSEDN